MINDNYVCKGSFTQWYQVLVNSIFYEIIFSKCFLRSQIVSNNFLYFQVNYMKIWSQTTTNGPLWPPKPAIQPFWSTKPTKFCPPKLVIFSHITGAITQPQQLQLLSPPHSPPCSARGAVPPHIYWAIIWKLPQLPITFFRSISERTQIFEFFEGLFVRKCCSRSGRGNTGCPEC